MPAGASEDFLFCAVEIDSLLLLLLLLFIMIDPNSVYMDRWLTTFREYWARLTHFGKNGWDESRGARVFCGNPDDLSSTSQNLAAKRSSVSRP